MSFDVFCKDFFIERLIKQGSIYCMRRLKKEFINMFKIRMPLCDMFKIRMPLVLDLFD